MKKTENRIINKQAGLVYSNGRGLKDAACLAKLRATAFSQENHYTRVALFSHFQKWLVGGALLTF